MDPRDSPDPGRRTLPDPGFPGDAGEADARLAAALTRYAEDGRRAPVLVALSSARVLVPVVALLGEVEVDEQGLARGRLKPGSRLEHSARVVARGLITDGPFAETKEWVGGYWFIVAETLEQAATIAAENPCLQFGLSMEIRPLDATELAESRLRRASGRGYRYRHDGRHGHASKQHSAPSTFPPRAHHHRASGGERRLYPAR